MEDTQLLFKLIGDIIYKKDFYELAEKNYLANFILKKRTISMLPDEIHSIIIKLINTEKY